MRVFAGELVRRLVLGVVVIALGAQFVVLPVAATGGPTPQPPTNVQVSAIGPGNPTPDAKKAVVSWTASPATPTFPVSYKVTARPGPETCTVGAGGATSCVVTFTPAEACQTFSFTVAAINANGQSPASLPSAGYATHGLPAAPRWPNDDPSQGETAGDGQVKVTWWDPPSDGCSIISKYVATSSPDGFTCTTTGLPAPKSCTVTGLTDGLPYTFSVVATNDDGDGPPLTTSQPVTPAPVVGAALAPSGVTATCAPQPNGECLAPSKSVTVSWTRPQLTGIHTGSGGEPIYRYYVVADPPDADSTVHSCVSTVAGGSPSFAAPGTSCTVNGLTNGTEYTFTVQARYKDDQPDNLNAGPFSAPSNPATPATLPLASTKVKGVPGDSQVEVSWDKKFDGGSPITLYTVSATQVAGPTRPKAVVSPSCTSTDPRISRCIVTGLANGSAYTFKVVAHNAVGDGPASAASPAYTATKTLWVDGKLGRDTNNGACLVATSTCGPVKTIGQASRLIPPKSAPGWTVNVKGYSDYVYRYPDRIDKGFRSFGTAGNPIVFRAIGWAKPGDESYTKPIIDGGVQLTDQGWTRDASAAGVFYRAFATKPAGWQATGAFGDSASAIWQDGSKFIWNAKTLAALEALPAKNQAGYYWDGMAKRLYVAPIGKAVTGHKFNVPMDNTMFFKGENGVHDIKVAGFIVRHSDVGIGFVNGLDRGEAYDNVLEANLYMGIHTVGRMIASTPDPSDGDKIMYNVGRYNTVQAYKISFGTTNAVVSFNKAELNGLQGMKVQGNPPGQTYTGLTTNVMVANNQLFNHSCLNPACGVNDNATGITIANGAQHVTVQWNKIFDNAIGIHFTQEGMGPAPFVAITIQNNRVFDNRRYGLNVYDGAYAKAAATGDLNANHNMYWGNLVGIFVDQYSTNKTFTYETMYGNSQYGLAVNGRGVANSVTMSKSLITNNGKWGVSVSQGGKLNIQYCGVSDNANGKNLVNDPQHPGTITQANINSRPASYLSTDPSSANFLAIDATSFQYTAGPADSTHTSGTPIGARAL